MNPRHFTHALVSTGALLTAPAVSAANGIGGLFAFNANTTLINSVFADNVGQDCRISGGTVSAIGLLAESGTTCTPQITIDPQLQVLAARGGFTATRGLASTSPALGTGDPAFCLPVDQRGAPRVQQAGCDPGAFENERVFANGFQGPL